MEPFATVPPSASSSGAPHLATPPPFERLDPAVLVDMIAHVLEMEIQVNDRIPLMVDAVTRFHSRAPPVITARQYLRRIVQFASVENCCLLMLLLYFDRVAERTTPKLLISSLTVHRLVIASITVASKALCDNYYTNAYYAKMGGVTLQELNTLELELLFLIEWQLTASMEQLQECYYRILAKCGRMAPNVQLPIVQSQDAQPHAQGHQQPQQQQQQQSHHQPQQQQLQQQQLQQQQLQQPQHQFQQHLAPPQAADGSPRRISSPRPVAHRRGSASPAPPSSAPAADPSTPRSQKRPLEHGESDTPPPPSPSGRAMAVPLPFVS